MRSLYLGAAVLGVALACPARIGLAEARPSLSLSGRLRVTAEGEGGSARPEVVATADRVFVLYLGNIQSPDGRVFAARIYDASLGTIVASKTLVTASAQYGAPTDIRVASDGARAYTFYETHRRTSPTTAETYLWAASYALDDGFARVAQTPLPLARSQPLAEAPEGAELLDDPAPLVGEDRVFVLTRLKSSLGTAGRTAYRVRALHKDDLSLLSTFDLDLSQVADGRARVASLLVQGGRIMMALATTVSDQGLREDTDDGALSDVILIRMRPDWSFTPEDVVSVTAEPGDRENYVCGLEADERFLYVTYKQSVGVPPSGEHRAWIKVFDSDLRLVVQEQVKSAAWGPAGGEIRPSLELNAGWLFSGQSGGEGLGRGDAEVYVYAWQPAALP